MIIAVALAVAVLGAMVYLLSTNPKRAMLGIVAFGAGLLAFLLEVHSGAISFLK